MGRAHLDVATREDVEAALAAVHLVDKSPGQSDVVTICCTDAVKSLQTALNYHEQEPSFQLGQSFKTSTLYARVSISNSLVRSDWPADNSPCS